MTQAARAVEVSPVRTARERRAFLRLPWRLYAGDPHWVPPLRGALKRELDPRRHPFHAHADARLYLARRGARTVGRIAAIVNHLHNATHNDRIGFWGYFEAEPDLEVVRALLDAAADDLRAAGLDTMWGPFNPSINAECGLLVEGFDQMPALLMPYNPPAYPHLVERAGLRRVKDLYAYLLVTEDVSDDRETRRRLERIARAVARRHPELVIRPLDMARYEAEVVALGELFNRVRERNWAFVPATREELRLMAREMKPLIVPELIPVAELHGRPVGCLLALLDINPLLRELDGRLLPFGWLRLLRGVRRVRSLRVFGAACLPEYRKLGVTALLFDRFIRNGLGRGINRAELSWVAEDNVQSVQTLESAFHPRLYKRYRVYGRDL